MRHSSQSTRLRGRTSGYASPSSPAPIASIATLIPHSCCRTHPHGRMRTQVATHAETISPSHVPSTHLHICQNAHVSYALRHSTLSGRLSQPLIPFHLSPSLTCGSPPPFLHTLATTDMRMGKTQHTMHQFVHICILRAHSAPHSCTLTRSVLSVAMLPSYLRSRSHARAHVKPSQLPAMSHITHIAIASAPHSAYQERCFTQVNAILHFVCHKLVYAHVKPCISISLHTPSIPTPFLHPLALYLAQPSTCAAYRILLSSAFNISAQCYYVSTQVHACMSPFAC